MISNEDLKIKLDGYPPELLRNYADFVEGRSPDDLNAFVIGLIRFLQDTNDPAAAPGISDSTDLRRDMGIDSITIAEVVFLLEEILEIEIDNHDLAGITKIGQLKSYILGKVA